MTDPPPTTSNAGVTEAPATSPTTTTTTQLIDADMDTMRIRIPQAALEQALDAADEHVDTTGCAVSGTVRSALQRGAYSLTERMQKVNAGLSIAQLLHFCPQVREQLVCYLDEAAMQPHVLTLDVGDNEAFSLPVEIKGRILVAFIDTGASVHVINRRLARGLGLKIQPKDPPCWVRMGDGVRVPVREHVANLVTNVDGLLIPLDFLVMDEGGYDILLGREFLTKTGAQVDFKCGYFTLHWENESRVIRAIRGYKLRWEQEYRRNEG